jgi:nucleotide-binding universal stress UspA family protein
MPGIVVGIDGSRHSERALDWAIHEAALRRTALTVISVHPVVRNILGHAGTALPEDAPVIERTRQATQETTDKALARVGVARPDSVSVETVTGVPAEVLLAAAGDADMIVVGSRGAGGFSRLTMGSVGDQVARHAHCPVVIIPHEDEG